MYTNEIIFNLLRLLELVEGIHIIYQICYMLSLDTGKPLTESSFFVVSVLCRMKNFFPLIYIITIKILLSTIQILITVLHYRADTMGSENIMESLRNQVFKVRALIKSASSYKTGRQS